MLGIIDETLDELEQRRISRRQAVARIGALVVALGSGASIGRAEGEASGTFAATGLDHIALRVTDLARSRDFYTKHLGLKVQTQSEWNCFLSCGPDNFVALFASKNASMDHYCYAIENYDPAQVVKKLEGAGLNPRRQENRVYFDDPDGLTVQISGR